MSKPIAIQVYSLRNEAAADLEAVLKALHEYGYNGIELAGLYGNAPEVVRDLCAKYELTPISAHVTYDEMLERFDQVFADYATVGCKFMVLPSLSRSRIPGGDKFGETAENIKRFAAKAAEYGIRILYHNHDFEFDKVGNCYKFDLLYSALPAGVLDTEIDVCWVKVGGESPVDYLKKYAGRTPIVHIKDFYGEKSEDMYDLIGVQNTRPKRPGNFEFRPVGSGLQDIPAILAAADEAGATWYIVEQDNPSMGLTPLECAKKSAEYLLSL